jgi:hypothetical protein
MEHKYGVKRFKSTRDRGYNEALSIYARTTPADIRTNTNEISAFLDNPDSPQGDRAMYFFALLFNDIIIGFAELAYLNKIRSVVIDYIAIEEHYKKNSIFYPFLNLLLDYIIKDKADVIFTITEISVRNQGSDTDQESAFFKKMLSTEDFYIIDAPYYQPYLGNNIESNFKCELLIKMPAPAKHIASSTYMNIIREIYFSHYFVWYSRFMNDEEIERYNEHLQEQVQNIEAVILSNEIHLTSYKATECAYFENSRCAFSEISTAGNVPFAHQYSRKVWFYIPIFAVLTFGLSIGIYYCLEKISIPASTFAPLYATTSTAIATIVAAIFAIKYKKP